MSAVVSEEIFGFTLTVNVPPFELPSVAAYVTFAVPSLIPLISIEATSSLIFADETFTIASFDEVHLMSLMLAFEGAILTLNDLTSSSVMLKPSSGITVMGSIEVM